MAKIDYIVMGLYLAGILSVGFVLSKKVKSSGDLFAAGGRSPWWASGLSAFMTMFSAGTFVVWGGIAYERGLVAVSINLCYGVAALAAGYFLAGRWKNLGIDSPAEYVSLRFGKPAFRDTLALTPGISDMLATAYKFRTHDFEKLKIGEKVPFTMLVDNEVHNIYYRYLGKETITNRNKIPFTCHIFSILLLQGDFFPGGEYLKVWIDEGPYQLPVMVETKILVGSVKAVIESAEINGKPVKFEF